MIAFENTPAFQNDILGNPSASASTFQRRRTVSYLLHMRRLSPWELILMPLLGCVSGILKDCLPAYWQEQEARAERNGQRVIGPVWRERDNVRVVGGDKLTRENTDYPLFSTATINKNLLFSAHADAKNESGLACLMAFGRFAGGNLCLPRLRVAFRLRPGDILIADTNREQHGNIGPIAGERISVVGYLKDLSTKKKN
jgi:hypothetical protein